MPKICYTQKRFSVGSLEIIARANQIIDDYRKQGFDLTLRQLYYQFVSRGWIANKQTEYSRLGSIINDARLAGLVDWEAIIDRTRNLAKLNTWDSPTEILEACANQYKIDVWANQPYYVEVWVEKEALAGVVKTACDPLRVPYFACRGYVSQSEMWAAAQRLIRKAKNGGGDRDVVIIHLGDHDPSGIDMSRDIRERIELFCVDYSELIEIRRIALNFDQVQQYNPPPNPAKETDSRFRNYLDRYGDESWELDALDPNTLVALIRKTVKEYIDGSTWEEEMRDEERERNKLLEVAENWDSK